LDWHTPRIWQRVNGFGLIQTVFMMTTMQPRGLQGQRQWRGQEQGQGLLVRGHATWLL
jgi:hypothetical protein